MPKPEPKPVVTLEDRDRLMFDGWLVGYLRDGRFASSSLADEFNAEALRAIADWLDQWQDATLLSEADGERRAQ